jgi:hypothetical protein
VRASSDAIVAQYKFDDIIEGDIDLKSNQVIDFLKVMGSI